MRCYNRSSLLMISGNQTPRILLRQLLQRSVYPLCGGQCGTPRLCSVKKSSLDISIENPDLGFQGKDYGLPNVHVFSFGENYPYLSDPGFNVCFSSPVRQRQQKRMVCCNLRILNCQLRLTRNVCVFFSHPIQYILRMTGSFIFRASNCRIRSA